MKHKAYQIVNFKDPLSVKYFEHSQKSLKLIEDILDVEPVQCVTPEEVEDYNWPWKTGGHIYQKNGGRDRTIYEKACYLSHINLVKKMAQGEKFFVLEHDVYVWPEEKRLTVLYALLSNPYSYSGLFPGISNEFYYMNETVSKFYLIIAQEHNHDYGPLAAAAESLRHLKKQNKDLPQLVFPIGSLDNRIGIGDDIINIGKGNDCEILPAPITQHYILNQGSTIKTRATKWKVTRERNPNFYFTEE